MRYTINDLTQAQDIHNNLNYIQAVIHQGLISETRGTKHYCHHTTFTPAQVGGALVSVSCVLTRAGNISFVLRDVPLT
jgi:hypothetical protein